MSKFRNKVIRSIIEQRQKKIIEIEKILYDNNNEH